MTPTDFFITNHFEAMPAQPVSAPAPAVFDEAEFDAAFAAATAPKPAPFDPDEIDSLFAGWRQQQH